MPRPNLMDKAAKQAESATKPNEPKVIRGPEPVGNLGHVTITESENGSLYATFGNGRSRPKGIPLAAAQAAVALAES